MPALRQVLEVGIHLPLSLDGGCDACPLIRDEFESLVVVERCERDDRPDLSARAGAMRNGFALAGAAIDIAWGMLRRHGIDGRDRVEPVVGPLPDATQHVTLTAFRQARRDIATPVAADGVREPTRVGNSMTSFLVRHPQGNVLIDPAICDDVEHRVLPQLPAPMRAVVRPPASVVSVRRSLRDADLTFDDIDFALPTHLHWDHVSGLVDAPRIPLRVTEREWRWAMGGDRAPSGVARRALIGRAVEFYALDGPPVLGFARSHDVFGDGSVTAIDLAGHTPGSVGFLLHLGDAGPSGVRWALLVGDAVWHTVQVDHVRGKGIRRLFDSDPHGTLDVIRRLATLDPSITIVPSHDPDAAARFFEN